MKLQLLLLLCCWLPQGVQAWKVHVRKGFAALALVGATTLGCGPATILPAHANDVRQIGLIESGGLIPGFKDSLKVTSIADPRLPSVHLYLADFEKPLIEKIANNDLFSDPSSASLTCISTGYPSAEQLTSLPTGTSGEDVFSETKSMFKGKQIKIKRVYDKETNTAVYVAFSTRLFNADDGNKSRFKSSLCAVNLNGSP